MNSFAKRACAVALALAASSIAADAAAQAKYTAEIRRTSFVFMPRS